ncbi:MAG: 2-hydroxymuconic semialdehyde dehydrogenase [Deltaproteobacteria bacterium]|nr:2-hydroxymuconic semialdehyde dehydrogenase [Deltaproteobacteria bacterium]
MPVIPCFIDGKARETDKRFDDVNPTTGAKAHEVCEADAGVVDEAVQAASRALRGPWRQKSPAERATLLEKVADGIDARRDEFIRAEIEDTGKPIALAGVLDIPRGAQNFRAFAQQLRTMGEESFTTATDDGRGALNLVVHEPLGVVGVICPWNLPLLLMTWKVAPALAAGNTVVVKPSEETPQTATLLGEVMKAAGVDDGVYNVVHGFGPGSAGEAIVKHGDVAAITFTGESKTGSAIMRDASPTLKRLSFELGGKNAAIVFDDADVDAAVAGTLRSCFWNTGQICLCTERVYVHRSIYQRFVEQLAAGAKKRVLGDPHAATTTMGPLISRAHQSKVLGYFENTAWDPKLGAATIVTGGSAAQPPEGYAGGFWVEPTIWTDVDDTHPLVTEEIFGPCTVVMPFDDEDEAVTRANASVYGLCCALWTRDLQRAHRVSRAVDAGLVWVNTWYLRDLRTPFGGKKRSGIGREGGRFSFDFYAEPKNICIKL